MRPDLIRFGPITAIMNSARQRTRPTRRAGAPLTRCRYMSCSCDRKAGCLLDLLVEVLHRHRNRKPTSSVNSKRIQTGWPEVISLDAELIATGNAAVGVTVGPNHGQMLDQGEPGVTESAAHSCCVPRGLKKMQLSPRISHRVSVMYRRRAAAVSSRRSDATQYESDRFQ